VKRKQIVIYVFLFLLIGGALVPYPTTDIPKWHITTLDASGNPVQGVRVHQIWKHGGLFGASNREIQVTGEDGTIIFHPRAKWIPLSLRGVGMALDGLNYIVSPHGATVGPSAIVFAEGAQSGSLHYSGEESPESLVRMKPGARGQAPGP
jgi:hypothetical protein